MNRIKKCISFLIIACMSVSIFSTAAVFAAVGAGDVADVDFVLTTAATVTPSDYFAANALDNVVGTDYQTTLAEGGNVTMTTNADNSVTFYAKGNATSQGRKGITGNWKKEGTLIVTMDYQFTGIIPEGGTYFQQLNLHIGNWFNGPEFVTDGNKYTIKAVMDFADVTNGNVNMKWYQKSFGADDSTYTLVYTHTNPKPTDVSVLQPHWKVVTQNYPDETTSYEGFTIDNLNISEKPVAKIDLQDLTGANYSTEDTIDINVFLPEGYSAATLKINNTPVAEYALESYPAGSYKTTVPLTGFDGENVLVELSATVNGSSQTKSTSIDKITDPAKRKLEINNLTGKNYTNADSVDLTMYFPVGYTEAALKIGGENAKTYSPANYAAGQVHTDSVSLKKYLGENVTVELSATVNGDTQTATTSIDRIDDSFVPKFTDFPGGHYITADTVKIGLSLPEGYTTAKLKIADKTVKEYSAEQSPSGEYTLDVSLAEFPGKNIPVSLIAVVDGKAKTVTDKIDSVTSVANVTCLADEDFSGDSTSFTMNNGEVKNGVVTDSEDGYNHNIQLAGLTVANGYCGEIEFDIMLTDKASYAGAYVRSYEKNSIDTYFPKQGGWFNGQQNGVFEYNKEVSYELNKWNRVKYRMFATSDKMYVYLNGKYVGSTPMEECLGFSTIGIGWNTKGKPIYIDNVEIKTWTPYYGATVYAVDKDGKKLDAIDYSNPKIKVEFDMAMNEASVSAENISLTSFNGRTIEYDGSYDSKTHGFIITPKEALIPGKEYSVTLNDKVKSIAGTANNSKTYIISTAEQPFRLLTPTVDLGNITASTSSVSVPVKIEGGNGNNATVFIALYRDGKLVSIKTDNVVNGMPESNTVNLTPNGAGNYKVAMFMCKGINDYSALDDLTVSK